jgi:hypothetical protein
LALPKYCKNFSDLPSPSRTGTVQEQ